MNQPKHIIEHIIEPKKLLLIWRSQGQGHTCRIVADIVHESNDVVLRYPPNSPDFEAASDEGFDGYPAFRLSPSEHRQGVLDAFMRRLPPRNREDFLEY